MDFPEFKSLVSEIKIGKQLPDAVYVHKSALSFVPAKLSGVTAKIHAALKIPEDSWNIVKFGRRDFRLAFLHYPAFDDYAYPSLHECFTVDLAKFSLRKADYSQSMNPPILHRKETFVAPDYSNYKQFISLTKEGEAVGLYENTRTIGFKNNWERLIKSKGYYLDEKGRLHPLYSQRGSDGKMKPPASIAEQAPNVSAMPLIRVDVLRHKTAIDRNKLSKPMQTLARHDYLNGDYSVLDYGCGKGDDVRELEAHGIDINGWDPVHNPEGSLLNSDVVNLGFVLNVIEEREERNEALRRAWEYADKLLIVSVMIGGESIIGQFTPYKDGVVTSRNTFQKYFSQGEFRTYLEHTLEAKATPVGQGIFILFKDEIEEQTFLLKRQHIRRDWKQITARSTKPLPAPAVKKDLMARHSELFADFWETVLDLGRIPANAEFEFSDQIRRITGSHNKAFQALLEEFGETVFNEAQAKRKEDLLVYFALSLFDKRKPKTHLPENLKRDIKAFFSSYNQALEIARETLFRVGEPQVIERACNEAYAKLRCGDLAQGHSYTFHKQYLGDLPPELRIYIGCATQLYGDLDSIQLIKAHMASGKVSLMRYDDWGQETPMLVERIKIKMRELDIDFFDYSGEFEPQPLTNKICFSVASA